MDESTGQNLAEMLTALEAIAVSDAAPADILDRRRSVIAAAMAEVGLDPADRGHRRAVAFGLAASRSNWGESLEMTVAALLRPPVTA